MQAEQASDSATLTGADGEIVAALRAGDEDAFRELFARHYPAMKRLARTYVASDAVAEEVVQETWMAVVTRIERFEGRSTLRTWIFSILINQAKTHGARERRALPFSSVASGAADEPVVDADRFQREDDAWPGHWATPPRPWERPEQRLLSLEARKHLKLGLAQLPDRQRVIVGLRDVEGLSAEDVCGLLQLSQENQRVLLHRGRSRLRAELEAYLDETA
jgi:RNA polymerase sigma-70 factor (ECF subfamily)